MKRRSFVLKGVAAAAVLASPRSLLAQQAAGKAPDSAAAKIPPEIPPPPGRQVYLDRMDRARELLGKAGSAALIEIPGANLRYLTGLDMEWTAPLVFFVLPVEGPPAIFAPEMARELIEAAPAPIEDRRLWSEDENAPGLLEKYIKKGDLDDKTICVGEKIWYSEFYRLHAGFAKMNFISTSGIVERERQRKSVEEVALVKAAAAIAEQAIARAWPLVRQGMTETDLAWILDSLVHDMGAEGDSSVLFGDRTALPLYPAGRAELGKDDVICVTCQARLHGYWGRVTRTAVLGKPSGRMKLIHETLRKAQDLSREQAAPETACSTIGLRARSVVGSAGFLKFYRGRLGWGLGLAQEESPYLSRGYHERMEDGQVVVVEPGLYTPGEYGVQIGDMLAVTLTGSRWLTSPPEGIVEL